MRIFLVNECINILLWSYSHNSSNCYDILFLLSFPDTNISWYPYLEMSFTSLVGILMSLLFRRGGLNLINTKIYQYYLFSLFGADPPCFNSNWALFVWVKISGAVLNFYKNNAITSLQKFIFYTVFSSMKGFRVLQKRLKAIEVFMRYIL